LRSASTFFVRSAGTAPGLRRFYLMAHEIELKLDAPAKAAARLPKTPWLQKLARAPARRQRLVSVYFDTRAFKLRKAGMSLRVRHQGDKTVQTVKRDPKGACGALTREEWECEIAGGEPDLDVAEHTALAQFNLKKLGRKLRPVFETDVERVAIVLEHQDNKLELAIDRGEVRAGDRSEPLSEVELEVKDSEPIEAVKLARRIAAETAASYGTKSKAERGYALSAGKEHAPVFGDEIPLRPPMPAGQALQAIGFSCLHHFAANHDAVAHGDPEGVHQMRVGLRRFRAALSLFRELVQQPDAEHIKSELKWLTEQLGAARDFDVLLKEGVKRLRRQEPEAGEVAALENDLEQRSRAAFARAKAAVESDRYRRLVLECAFWLAGGDWFTSRDPLIAARRDILVSDFAAAELTRRTGKIIKRSKKLEALDARRRHKLRIAIKKVRYACEFFTYVYEGRKAARRRKEFTATLKGIQSGLGRLNDVQVHGKLAHRFAHRSRRAARQTEKAFAIGLLAGREHAEVRAILVDAIKAARRISDAKPFWR
jgi:inorganic triphosphatase YgiF